MSVQVSVQTLHKKLNEKGYICDVPFASRVASCIHAKPTSGAFLYGPAGTGKSFIIFYFLAKLQLMGVDKEEIAVTSTTGISASLIGGTTLHSFAGIGLGNKNFEYYYDYHS